MKFTAFAVLFLSSVVNAKEFDCTQCFADLDDTTDCLRECDNNGFLDECLARTDKDWNDPNDTGLEEIKDLKDFSDCCQFDGSCKSDMERTEDCMIECLDPCIRETPKDYIDCINEEVRKNPDSDKCGRQACITGFLDEDEGVEGELDVSNDFLDIKNLEKTLTEISESDLEDCSALEDFVNEVCDVGKDCCEKCNNELGEVIDCLINDVVIPVLALQLNTTIDACPVDADKCELVKKRELSQGQVDQFNAFVTGAKTRTWNLPISKRDPIKDASHHRMLDNEPTNVESCEGELTQGLILSNVTDGANNYMECVMGAATDALANAETNAETDESASSVISKMAAFVAAFLALVF